MKRRKTMKKSILAVSAALMSLCLCAQPMQMLSASCADTTAVADEVVELPLNNIAVDKMNVLSMLIAILGASPTYTHESDTEGYREINSGMFESYDLLTERIQETTTGKLREELLAEAAQNVILVNGKLCVKENGRSYYSFPTASGVELTNVTDDTFSATTKEASELYGKGTAHFVKEGGEWRISLYSFSDSENTLDELALSKVKDLNLILAIMGGSPLYTEPTDNEELLKIKDERFTTMYDFHTLIESVTGNELRQSLLIESEKCITDYKDALCVRKSERAYYSFPLGHGLKLLNKTDDTFTAETVEKDDLNGVGQVYFSRYGDNWYIDHYQFSNSEFSLENEANGKIDELNMIIAVLGASPACTQDSGTEGFAKITDPRFDTSEELLAAIDSITAGNLNETLHKEYIENVVDVKGELCVKQQGRSFFNFPLATGVTISDQTNESFTAKTNSASDLFGYGTAFFGKEDGKWYVVHYQYGDDQPSDVTFGDPNGDGKIDAKDASAILVEYSKMSTGGEGSLSDAQKSAANVNGDDKIDAKDASFILSYYAMASTATGDVPTMAEFMASKSE